MEKKAFGIDLGTTYSCISYLDDLKGEPVVVDNVEGTNVTPSVVYFENANNIVVGERAKEYAVMDPDATCEFVKRRMGRDKIAINYDGTDYSPEQISALILKKLVEDAEKALDTKIEDVVITCPAYFGAAEKEATRAAGIIAGLNVLEIINEPTAAALCYGSLRDVENKTILVYDLGGGTFDVTIIKVTPEEIVAIATDGDHELGGKDWDAQLVEYLKERFCEEKGFDEELDPESEQDLVLKAEKAKQQLTGMEKTDVMLSMNGKRGRITVTRETFEDLNAANLKRTITKTNAAIDAARAKGCETIDEIILVGGSCKMPQVERAVKENFPNIPIKMFEPNEAVAKGAAIHADALMKGDSHLQQWKGWEELNDLIEQLKSDSESEDGKIDMESEAVQKKVQDFADKHSESAEEITLFIKGEKKPVSARKLKNITSKSYGIEAVRRNPGTETGWESYLYNLILKQDEVPADVTQQFRTLEEGQMTTEINVYETDVPERTYDHIEMFEPLGTATLKLPEGLPEGAPIDVTLRLSTDGLLTVVGVDKTSGETVEAVMQTATILTEDEIEKQRSQMTGIEII